MQTISDLETIDISLDDLDHVSGGITQAQWNDVKAQAQPYCPSTVAKYGSMNPATITRGVANKMASSCVAEMPGWEQGIAKGRFNTILDQYFPKK